MPPKIFLHDHKDFPDLLRIVAEELRIAPTLVEKDYWIMQHPPCGHAKAFRAIFSRNCAIWLARFGAIDKCLLVIGG